MIFTAEKSFGDWLVASDVDGTLNTKFRRLHPKNKMAIKEFMNRGGNFMLASGRPVKSLERAYRKVHPNCPCAVLNGAGLYDFEKRDFIFKESIPQRGKDFVKMIIRKYSSGKNALNVAVFGEKTVYIIKNGLMALGQVLFDRNAFMITDVDSIPEDDWLKVIFWAKRSTIAKLNRDIAADTSVGTFMATSPFTVEMCKAGVHKGTAVMKMAEMKGVTKDKVAAIGDYYNDWDMLKTVGVPACAGQAPTPIHDICRLVACHCNRGCVAQLVNYVMYGNAKGPVKTAAT